MDRHIPFTDVHNFRDLGGYETADGRRTRWRRLFRADALGSLAESEAEWLRVEIGLRTIIDMQGAIDRKPGPLETGGVIRHKVAVWDDHMQEMLLRRDRPISGELYVTLVERFGSSFTEAIRLLSYEETYPAVFHCTVGKDRTGILAALLLSTLGVDDETIVEDYGLTSQVIDRIRERLLASPNLPNEFKTRIDHTLAVEPNAIAEMLGHIRTHHGSTRGYLAVHGLGETDLENLRRALLD